MNGDVPSQYLYLNRGGRWQDCRRHGLDLGADGVLRLASLPRLVAAPPGRPAPAHPTRPAGIAFLPDGSLVWTDPGGDRILRRDGCDGAEGPVPCLGGAGDQPTQLCEPRGLVFHRRRKALIVADTGNHRLQVFDAASLQLLAVWGRPMWQADPWPDPDQPPPPLDRPVGLADDAEGNLYVADDGNRSVQKFDAGGNLIASFWDAVRQQSPAPRQPVAVAVDEASGRVRVLVLDAEVHLVLVYDAAGAFQHGIDVKEATSPLGLAVAAGAVYVGDAAGLRVHKYRLDDGTLVGEGEDAVAAAGLAPDGRGNLAAVGEDGSPPVLLALAGGHVREGHVLAGPFADPSGRPDQMHLLRADWGDLPAGGHAQLFFAVTQPPAWDEPATAPSDVVSTDQPTQDLSAFLAPGGADKCKGWVRVPLDAPECLFPGSAGGSVWVGVELTGEGSDGPALSQARLDFDHETYLQYLPAIYRDDPLSESFLGRLLTLFEGRFRDVEGRIAGLAALFDPDAAPADRLDELGGLLGLSFPETWDAARKRRGVRRAFEEAGRAGTAGELRRALWEELGVAARIEEPILQSAWWCLPDDGDVGARSETGPNGRGGDDSLLGFTTRLAGVEPSGAVVGATAELGQSQLIDADAFGSALFADVAHRFSVLVYARWGDAATLAAVRALLDTEKPAHTVYRVCVVQPAMRVGFQARLGVDAVVAGPAPAAAPGQTVLGDVRAGRVGADSRVGQTTRLGSPTVPC